MLVTVPLFHLSGLYAAAVMMLSIGAKTVYRRGSFDPEDVMQLIEREGVTTWTALGNTGARRWSTIPRLESTTCEYPEHRLRRRADTARCTRTPAAKHSPTPPRSSAWGTDFPSRAGWVRRSGAELLEHPTSTGRATPCHELQIRDATGKPLPEGAQGEIHIRSAYLMLRYWRDEAATQQTMRPDRWLATGDIGHLEDACCTSTRGRGT